MKKIQINKNSIVWIPIIILFLGIIIRLSFTGYFGIKETYKDFWGAETYVHDVPEHIQYVQFIAENLTLPEVDKGLEYPQQPLYYITIGVAYQLLNILFNIPSDKIFRILIWFSCIFSIGTLIFTFLTIKQLKLPIWIQSFIIGIFAFTPSFIFQSIMISNDALLPLTASASFFFLIKYLKNEKLIYLILSVIWAILSVFTKISAGLLLIIILFALIYKYKQKNDKNILLMSGAVLLIGFLCFAMALHRAYIPSVKQFRFVESYKYEHQKTNPESFSYFLDFNFIDLVKEGQSYVFGNESVARTLPTFLYGSFLFGEFNYDNVVNIYPQIKLLMRIIIILGLLFPIGLIVNLFFIKKWDIIDYVSGLGIIINFILIVYFLYKYPSVCNSDFRYFVPSFTGLLIFSGMGIHRLTEKYSKSKIIVATLYFSLIFLELIWVISRIIIRASINI